MSTLEPGILKVLRKLPKDGSMSVDVIADKIGARAGWVFRACAQLAKDGKVIRTKDSDEDGRWPFYALLTLDNVPELTPEEESPAKISAKPMGLKALFEDDEPQKCAIAPASHDLKATSALELAVAISGIATTAGYETTWVQVEQGMVTVILRIPPAKAP
jgi:hypothetical protein